MKTIGIGLFTAMMIMSLPIYSEACPLCLFKKDKADEEISSSAVNEESQLKTIHYKVEGMTCGGCASGIKSSLEKTEGVKKADVSYKKGEAVVKIDPSQISEEAVLETIEESGYKAEIKKEPEQKK